MVETSSDIEGSYVVSYWLWKSALPNTTKALEITLNHSVTCWSGDHIYCLV